MHTRAYFRFANRRKRCQINRRHDSNWQCANRNIHTIGVQRQQNTIFKLFTLITITARTNGNETQSDLCYF